ncbi:right-handed parallel beta-helix repeat-containing protein [Leifsonia sp. Root112D2]|uniref:right-handed parallel beta-helix repeat-containing protein n=1 Tax=Leifsonia sp. Root112D2 TaxID=1736426 RepID=UPI0006F2A1B9|nr:right-handed parallel beta-helix repeat-containing protein [Leifsonia sp. Root112D2]
MSSRDSDASLVVIVPSLPKSGKGVYAGLQLRSAAGSYYQAQLRIGSDRTASLALLRVNGSTVSQVALVGEKVIARNLVAGSRINLEFQTTGSTPVALAARAWLAGVPKPGWQAMTKDATSKRLQNSGAFGVWSYLSRTTSKQPVAFDNLAVYTMTTALTSIPSTPTPTPPLVVAQTPPTPNPSRTPTTPTVPAPGQTAGGGGQDASVDMTGTRRATGAAAIGSTRYPVPADAIVVAPAGSDSAQGTLKAPYSTVQHAVDAARSGATIVLRAGSYHESVTIPASKRLTIQSYPGEAVWFDGSVPVTNWQQSGSAWTASGWNHIFDSSATYTRGAPDASAAGWTWLNPSYPMAAHPDQVWVGGVAQAQVASRTQLAPGRFYYDTAARTLYLGTDPRGGNVRASDLQKAMTIQGSGTVLRGFGVHRYAPSVPDMGSVTSYGGGCTFENMAFNDNATTGLSVGGVGVTLRNVTAARNGLLGIHGNQADSLKATGLLASGNNAEHFNTSPVSGGMKVTRSRGVQVTDSAFVRNLGPGLWMDESVYNMTIANNDVVGNASHGIAIEISAKVILANNLVTGNRGDGFKVNDTSDVSIWNNTLTDNVRNLDVVQDLRRASDRSVPGHDPRQAFPDPTMTWVLKSITIHNNVISGGSGNCLLCIEDYSHQYSAAQMQVSSDGNIYQRPSANAPTWLVVWSQSAGNPSVYNSLSQFTAATGQESHSRAFDSANAVKATVLTPQASAFVSAVALPLPANVAGLVGQSAGTRHLGTW